MATTAVNSVTCPSEISASTCLLPWRGILTVAGLGHLSVALALLVDLSVLLGAEELTITLL